MMGSLRRACRLGISTALRRPAAPSEARRFLLATHRRASTWRPTHLGSRLSSSSTWCTSSFLSVSACYTPAFVSASPSTASSTSSAASSALSTLSAAVAAAAAATAAAVFTTTASADCAWWNPQSSSSTSAAARSAERKLFGWRSRRTGKARALVSDDEIVLMSTLINQLVDLDDWTEEEEQDIFEHCVAMTVEEVGTLLPSPFYELLQNSTAKYSKESAEALRSRLEVGRVVVVEREGGRQGQGRGECWVMLS